MEHRSIGSLKVSRLGMGCNQLGTKACDAMVGFRIVNEAIDAGITYFDTSDEYGRDYSNEADVSGWGRSEEVLGRAVAARRDEVVIATKFGPTGPVVDGKAPYDWERSEGGRRGITLAVEESLRRLGTDRIDHYQIHFPDPRFPIEETLETLDELVRAGKVREIGCCNFSSAQLREADAVATANALARFVSDESALNLLQRKSLTDPIPACEELGVAFVAYFPLASGVLTGKYSRHDRTPPGARLTLMDDATRERLLSDRTFDKLEVLDEYARRHDHALIELAFGWLLGIGAVTSLIAGAARPGQPTANVAAAAAWVLTPFEMEQVSALL
jgi:aryl-alcohol dehydrogenase-like predicted oxidoreductase